MKGLIFRYYAIYALLLALFACISYFVPQIELAPDNAYIVSVVCIFFLFTIPATLKLFSVKTKGNKKLKTREEKEANYEKEIKEASGQRSGCAGGAAGASGVCDG